MKSITEKRTIEEIKAEEARENKKNSLLLGAWLILTMGALLAAYFIDKFS